MSNKVDELCQDYLLAANEAEKFLNLAAIAKHKYETAELNEYRKTRANEMDFGNSFAWLMNQNKGITS